MIKDQIGISEILIGGKECRMEAERRGREEETKREGREEPGRGSHLARAKKGYWMVGVIRLLTGGYAVNFLHASYKSVVASTLLTHSWV